MSDITIRTGGAPTESAVLVNVDDTSVGGDGSLNHPLKTLPGGTAVSVDGTSILGNGTASDPLHTGSSGSSVSFLPGVWAESSWSSPSDQTMVLTGTTSDGVPTPIGGSIVGIAAKLKQAITAGSVTVLVLANGSPTGASLVMTLDSPTLVTFSAGAHTFTAGQLITLELDVSSGQTPADTNAIDVSVQWEPT